MRGTYQRGSEECLSGKKVSSSHTKKQTVIITEQDIPEQGLKDVVAKAGYDIVSVSSEPYEKKGLFSAFKGH